MSYFGPQIKMVPMKQPPSPVKITCALTCYNEEARIGHVLAHSLCWADEVLVINKSSTDHTVDICASHGPKVKVINFPFTEQGDDNPAAYFIHAENDWIFVITCSEVPTRKVIAAANEILSRAGDDTDLICVPRKIYSFGEHHPNSPWSVSYYPFLVHRKRAVITKQIHANFTTTDPSRIATIPYADDCCVHHFTHTSATGYIETVGKYVRIEVEQMDDRHLEAKIAESLGQIRRHLTGIFRCGGQWPTILAAWCIYHFGLILHAMERLNGGPAQARYQAMRADLISAEWGVTGLAGKLPEQGRDAAGPAERGLGRSSALTLKTACMVGIVCLCVLRPGLIWGTLKDSLRPMVHAWRRRWRGSGPGSA